jgi:hypothetical protein
MLEEIKIYVDGGFNSWVDLPRYPKVGEPMQLQLRGDSAPRLYMTLEVRWDAVNVTPAAEA